MRRPSILPLSQYCGHAAKLAEDYPEGSTASAAGTEWHRTMSDPALRSREQHTIWATLPPHEKAETEVALEVVDPESGEVVTAGTADVVLTHGDGSISVIDWKTGLPDRVDPPDENLQLHAYGVAAALTRNAPMYRVGVYFTQFPPLQLSDWMETSTYLSTLMRIEAATKTDPNVPIIGPHCDKCFRRRHCRAWMLPAHDATSALAPFTEGGGALSAKTAPVALEFVNAVKDMLKVAEAHLKDYARLHGGIVVGTKVWGPSMARGRRSLSLERAEDAGLLPVLEEAGAVRDGSPYEVFSWRNVDRSSEKKRGSAD